MHVYRVFNTRFIRVSGMWASGTAHVHTRDSPCAQAGQLVCIRGAAGVHTWGSPCAHAGQPACAHRFSQLCARQLCGCPKCPTCACTSAAPRVHTRDSPVAVVAAVVVVVDAAATAGSGSVPCAS
jgi:hypothetical protein